MSEKLKNFTSTLNPTKTIQVRVADFPHGLRVFDDVQMVRIKSNGYNLLIMADHVPVIGEINGDVELVLNSDIQTFDNVAAFYMHRDNVLSILIKD